MAFVEKKPIGQPNACAACDVLKIACDRFHNNSNCNNNNNNGEGKNLKTIIMVRHRDICDKIPLATVSCERLIDRIHTRPATAETTASSRVFPGIPRRRPITQRSDFDFGVVAEISSSPHHLSVVGDWFMFNRKMYVFPPFFKIAPPPKHNVDLPNASFFVLSVFYYYYYCTSRWTVPVFSSTWSVDIVIFRFRNVCLRPTHTHRVLMFFFPFSRKKLSFIFRRFGLHNQRKRFRRVRCPVFGC